MNRCAIMLSIFWLFLSACEKVVPDIVAHNQPDAIIEMEGIHRSISLYCGTDSTNLVGFKSFLQSFATIHLPDTTSDAELADYGIFIRKAERGETSEALDIRGTGYVVKGGYDKLVIAGSDEAWTAIGLFALEEYLFQQGLAVKDSVLTIPDDLYLKEDYSDPQLLAKLIERQYPFSLETEFILSCPGEGISTIGQGATSDSTHFYIINKDSGDSQSIVFKYDMKSNKQIGKSKVFYAGHSNDLAYIPEKNMLVVAHGLTQGRILTLVNADDLSVVSDVNISVGASSVSYNALRKQFVFSQSGATLHFTDENFNLIKSFSRQTISGYTTQGMGSDDSFIYFPMSGSRDNILAVYDWSGNFVTTIKLAFSYESESLFYSAGEYYMNFNHTGSKLYRIIPALYYSYSPRD